MWCRCKAVLLAALLLLGSLNPPQIGCKTLHQITLPCKVLIKITIRFAGKKKKKDTFSPRVLSQGSLPGFLWTL